MTTKRIYTTNPLCVDHICRPTEANQKNEQSVWAGLRRLAATIGEYAIEVYRYNNHSQPVFSNGGTRVLIRPDRIDLV